MTDSTPLVEIDTASPVPVYRQIASALRAHLVAGRFPPGASLPTVRRLAIDLAINHNTVAEAYRLLSDEGWLDLRRAHGATVRDRPRPRPERGDLAAFGRRLHELVAEGRAAGIPVASIQRLLKGALVPLDNGSAA
jgi:GntR family transcriptional regulator